MKSIFKSVLGIAVFLVASMCAIASAQAATPGIYNMPNEGIVVDVTTVKLVVMYNANFITITYADGTTCTCSDTGLAVFTKIKADPNFFTFDGGNTAVNLRQVRKAYPYNANNTNILWVGGSTNASTYGDTGGATYAAMQAASN